MKTKLIFLLTIFFFLTPDISSQRQNFDTVTAQKFDMGKMWTFDNPPLDYFEQEYGFRPDEEWLTSVRQSALRLGGGCSASFISEDGLIMTNHHCIRGQITSVEKEGENFLRDRFHAKDISEERVIKGLYVDQLMSIQDVTEIIHSAMSKAENDSEKVKIRKEKIAEIEKDSKKKDSTLHYQIVPLYNGGKYSVYGYKRYNDIRLVFAPDLRTAKFGGDYDNFTYPRYGLDCAFLRAYENNQPVKIKDYFRWSKYGAEPGEVVFVVGNPGSTGRLSTISQMEYARDIQYPMTVDMLKSLYALQEKRVMANNGEDFKQVARLYSIGNSLKVYQGMLNGLHDEYLMARKKDFEKKFREAVKNNPELNKIYSGIWDDISESRKAASKYAGEMYAYTINPFYASEYFIIARDLVQQANQILKMGKMPPTRAEMDSLLNDLYPENVDHEYQRELLKIQADIIINNLGSDHQIVQKLFGNRKGYEAVDYLLANSDFRDKKSFMKFSGMTVEEILKSDDPFIYFIVNTQDRLSEMRKLNEGIQTEESINKQLLGEALFSVYGESIPPDATFTLRIADGVLQSYEYNGTIAPVYTTFYGVLDRYYGFNKKFPYNLSEIWENLPKEFNLSTKLDFISTNDIIGGNSGSPVINKKGEIVGLAFDGNLESLPAHYIFTTEANRTVSVHSEGMIEGIRDLYKAYNIADEILNGKMSR
jgi:hypothetical protein